VAISIILNKNVKDAILILYNNLRKKMIKIKNISAQIIKIQHNNLLYRIYFLLLIMENKTIIINKIMILN